MNEDFNDGWNDADKLLRFCYTTEEVREALCAQMAESEGYGEGVMARLEDPLQ